MAAAAVGTRLQDGPPAATATLNGKPQNMRQDLCTGLQSHEFLQLHTPTRAVQPQTARMTQVLAGLQSHELLQPHTTTRAVQPLTAHMTQALARPAIP